MAVTINKAYVKTYEANVRHLAQQGEAKLRNWVMDRGVQSEQHIWQRLGKSSAAEKTARKVATPDVETVWSRRVSAPKTYHIGNVVEPEDIVQMLVDPHSNYAKTHAMAMRRQVDDVIIAAATGTALDGDGVANAFPAGQVIGTGIAAITFNDFTLVQEKFLANDIDPDEPKVMVIGPKQVRTMLQTDKMTSGDYMNLKALQDRGFIDNFMGFSIIMSNRLLSSGGSKLSCLCFTKKAIGLQVNKDIWSRAEEDPTLSFMYRLYSAMTLGAVRVEDEHIVHLEVLNT